MTIAVNCESCGMPLAGAEEHALGDASIPYCNHCAPDGKLPAAQERVERFTQWMMSQGESDYATAREKAIAHMKTMPAWKDAF